MAADPRLRLQSREVEFQPIRFLLFPHCVVAKKQSGLTVTRFVKENYQCWVTTYTVEQNKCKILIQMPATQKTYDLVPHSFEMSCLQKQNHH